MCTHTMTRSFIQRNQTNKKYAKYCQLNKGVCVEPVSYVVNVYLGLNEGISFSMTWR